MNPEVELEKVVLALDIGGTKTAAAVITMDGHILSKLIVPTLQEGPERGIEQLIALLDDLVQQSDHHPDQCIGIGVGIPAVLGTANDFIIWGPNLKGWRDVDLRGPLESHFHLPVCVEYDGHTAVMGEWWRGSGQGYGSVVSIIIGTGVGGGLVLDGRLIRGLNRLAGAVGWFVLDWEEDPGVERDRSMGAWESRIAGPGIARSAQELLQGRSEASSLSDIEGGFRAEDVFEAAQKGDPLASEIVSETAEWMGRGIANIISLVNPEIIVLGGSVGSNAAFLLPLIRSVVDRCAQPISCKSVRITASQLGADAGLFGAAYGLMLRLKEMEGRI